MPDVFPGDQENVPQPYTDKLFFKKKTDIPMGVHCWLTATAPEDPTGGWILLGGAFVQRPISAGAVIRAAFSDTWGNLIRIVEDTPEEVAKKTMSVVKRLIVGYAFLFLSIVVGVTIGLPFFLTAGVGLGLLPANGFPFPQAEFTVVTCLSLAITVAVGVRWLCIPWPWWDAQLTKLREHLIRTRRPILLRMLGVWLAVPLFAFVVSPWVVFWLALEAGRSYLGLSERWVEYQHVIAAIVGFVWLVVVLGRLCPRRGSVRQLVLRCRTVFLDWVLEPANPQAARRERARLQHDCSPGPGAT